MAQAVVERVDGGKVQELLERQGAKITAEQAIALASAIQARLAAATGAAAALLMQEFKVQYSCDQHLHFRLQIWGEDANFGGEGLANQPSHASACEVKVMGSLPPNLYSKTSYFIVEQDNLCFLDDHYQLFDLWPMHLPDAAPVVGTGRWVQHR
ncbi:hypothetical protein GOP47_0001081 [Adiantum capillus-veneris]|uniref:Uncharacterized protein n=1 Tax=Adiantum capillus-veneris TaxID=13818 RepID=A0A9D4VGD2_ADICA|nr:hypothetical protein GOP47_0001081 [Adiantum capillus-veneris]